MSNSRFYLDGERVRAADASRVGAEQYNEQLGGMEAEGGDGAVKSENPAITIKVRDQAGEVMFFKVKKSTEMKKIFDAYAQRLGVQARNLKFLLDGERIKESDTPKMLELGDEDQIDVVLEQVGGMEAEGGDGAVKSENPPITIKVRDQAGEVMFFKVKKSTEMKKIFDAYAQRLGVQARNLKFLLDGERIKESDTPKMLELGDEDQIDVVLEQVGGMESGDAKPTGDDAVLTIRVKDAEGNEIAFKVKKSTKMAKIIEAYASRKGVQAQAVRFMTEEGVRITPEHTAKMLELEDDSVVSAFIEQIGGL